MWTSLTTVRVLHLLAACIWAIFVHWDPLPKYIGGGSSSPSMMSRSGRRKWGTTSRATSVRLRRSSQTSLRRRSWLDGWCLYRRRKPRGDTLINLFASLRRASWRSRMGVTGSYMTAHMECSSTTRFWLRTDWKTQVQGKWRASWRHRWLLVSVAYFHWTLTSQKLTVGSWCAKRTGESKPAETRPLHLSFG